MRTTLSLHTQANPPLPRFFLSFALQLLPATSSQMPAPHSSDDDAPRPSLSKASQSNLAHCGGQPDEESLPVRHATSHHPSVPTAHAPSFFSHFSLFSPPEETRPPLRN